MGLIAWGSALFLSSAQKHHTFATTVGECPSGQCFPGSVLKMPELWRGNLAGTDDGFAASPSAPRFPQPPCCPTVCTALSIPICLSLFPSIESDHFIIRAFLNSSLPCFASPGGKEACVMVSVVREQGAGDTMGVSSEKVVFQATESW